MSWPSSIAINSFESLIKFIAGLEVHQHTTKLHVCDEFHMLISQQIERISAEEVRSHTRT